MIGVVRFAWTAWGVDHHKVQHAVAAELVEALLSYCLLRVVSEGAECTSTAPRAWFLDKCVIQESAPVSNANTLAVSLRDAMEATNKTILLETA